MAFGRKSWRGPPPVSLTKQQQPNCLSLSQHFSVRLPPLSFDSKPHFDPTPQMYSGRKSFAGGRWGGKLFPLFGTRSRGYFPNGMPSVPIFPISSWNNRRKELFTALSSFPKRWPWRIAPAWRPWLVIAAPTLLVSTFLKWLRLTFRGNRATN